MLIIQVKLQNQKLFYLPFSKPQLDWILFNSFMLIYLKIVDKPMELTQKLVWSTQPNHGELVELLLVFQEFLDLVQAELDREHSEINVEKEEWVILWKLIEDGTEK